MKFGPAPEIAYNWRRPCLRFAQLTGENSIFRDANYRLPKGSDSASTMLSCFLATRSGTDSQEFQYVLKKQDHDHFCGVVDRDVRQRLRRISPIHRNAKLRSRRAGRNCSRFSKNTWGVATCWKNWMSTCVSRLPDVERVVLNLGTIVPSLRATRSSQRCCRRSAAFVGGFFPERYP